jgi:predicted ATPase
VSGADRAIVLTGTWGTGKTSLLKALEDEYQVIPEPGRIAVTEDPSLQGDWARFAHRLLQLTLEAIEAARPGITLFDRGLPDCLAYARWFEVDEAPFVDSARSEHHTAALICPPWEGIYTTDALRKADFGLAVEFHDVLVESYEDLGYELTEVPRGTVKGRARFVRSFIRGLA